MRFLREGIVLFSVGCAACSAGGPNEGDDTGGADAGGKASGSGGSGQSVSSGGSAGSVNGSGGASSGGTSTGGSSSGGSSNAGSSNAGGTGGSAGSNNGAGGTGGWTPPVCANGVPAAGLPPDAPELEPGVWTDISPDLPFAGGQGEGPFTQGFALDPCNPATIYVSTQGWVNSQDCGTYKTTNAGATWTQVGQLDEPIRFRVDPNDSQHLYAGDGVRGQTMGFWVSTDGGDTWIKPEGWKAAAADAGFIDDVYDVAVDPQDFAHVLVSSHSAWKWGDAVWGNGSGVMESTDGGDSWTIHEPHSTWGAGNDIWFLNNSTTWLLGTQGDGYWRTTNSGDDWTKVMDVGMTHGGAQIYYTAAGVLYASRGDGIARSTDDGATWESLGVVQYPTSVFGDGTTLYTHQAYGGAADNFKVSSETDGATWTAFGGESQKFTNGPFEMAFDAANGILYSANWGNGFLALKIAE